MYVLAARGRIVSRKERFLHLVKKVTWHWLVVFFLHFFQQLSITFFMHAFFIWNFQVHEFLLLFKWTAVTIGLKCNRYNPCGSYLSKAISGWHKTIDTYRANLKDNDNGLQLMYFMASGRKRREIDGGIKVGFLLSRLEIKLNFIFSQGLNLKF